MRILTSLRASRGYCLTCGWEGPLRRTHKEASQDAAAHADQMARPS